jgi:hypothetical protein
VIARSTILLAFLAVPAAAMTPVQASVYSAAIGRPVTSYVSVPQPQRRVDVAPTLMFAAGGAPLPVYLNRFGGSYQCGDDDSSRNISSVVCGSGASDVGPFSGSNGEWNFVRDCVADVFAPFNLYVTDVEPTAGEYVEAVVGGTPDQAGMPFGVGGVAPFSCGIIPSGVVYAFADVYGDDVQGICETVAQEVAHAFGLDHEFLCEDPMTYLGGCGAKDFQDVYAECGEFEPRQCQCGGSSQNSVQAMLQVLGASDGSPPPPPPNDVEVPQVALTSPRDGDVLPANSTISVSAEASDDIGLTLVELEWDFSGETFFCPATVQQTGNYSCTRSGSLYSWSIQVGAGGRTFRAHVRDVAGNEVTTPDRSIWLSEDGSGPPNDNAPPDVLIATPADGAELPANESMVVVATVADDAGIARAELIWTNVEEQAFPCPMTSDGVSCEVDGSTYTWTLAVGEGAREFYVRATDVVGNVTVSDTRAIELVTGAVVADDEDDDTLDRARALDCGESRRLDATDADWFSIDAPRGQDVEVTIDGQAEGSVSLVAATGPTSADVVDTGGNNVDFAGGDVVRVGVLPDDASAGRYTIEVTCSEPEAPEEAGCRQAGDTAPLLAGFLALLRWRRRAAPTRIGC